MNNASGVYLVNGHEQFFESRHTQQSDIASNVLHYGNLQQLIEGLFKDIDALIFVSSYCIG